MPFSTHFFLCGPSLPLFFSNGNLTWLEGEKGLGALLRKLRPALTLHTGQAQIPGTPEVSVPGTAHEKIVAFVISCLVHYDEEKAALTDYGQ